MITVGVDCGAKNIKVVVMKDKEVIGKALVPAGLDTKTAANEALSEALKAAGIGKGDVGKVLATGIGKKAVGFARDEVTEVAADAKGIHYVMPNVKTVIDIGAEEGRAVKVNGEGQVMDFAVNEKCAAGAGTFVEAMARTLEITVEEMSDLYAQSRREMTMHAHCAVFAESELVRLIHSGTAKPDIVRAVLTVIADRAVSLIRRVGIANDVAAIGGVALSKGFITEMEKELNIKIAVPPDAQFVGAIGAAVAAAE